MTFHVHLKYKYLNFWHFMVWIIFLVFKYDIFLEKLWRRYNECITRRNLSSYIFCLTISEGSCNSSTVCMKLLRDLSIILMISYLNMGCLMSFVYQLFSFLHIGSYASSKFRWNLNMYNMYICKTWIMVPANMSCISWFNDLWFKTSRYDPTSII